MTEQLTSAALARPPRKIAETIFGRTRSAGSMKHIVHLPKTALQCGGFRSERGFVRVTQSEKKTKKKRPKYLTFSF